MPPAYSQDMQSPPMNLFDENSPTVAVHSVVNIVPEEDNLDDTSTLSITESPNALLRVIFYSPCYSNMSYLVWVTQ